MHNHIHQKPDTKRNFKWIACWTAFVRIVFWSYRYSLVSTDCTHYDDQRVFVVVLRISLDRCPSFSGTVGKLYLGRIIFREYFWLKKKMYETIVKLYVLSTTSTFGKIYRFGIMMTCRACLWYPRSVRACTIVQIPKISFVPSMG